MCEDIDPIFGFPPAAAEEMREMIEIIRNNTVIRPIRPSIGVAVANGATKRLPPGPCAAASRVAAAQAAALQPQASTRHR